MLEATLLVDAESEIFNKYISVSKKMMLELH